jgi:hypothetical protein
VAFPNEYLANETPAKKNVATHTHIQNKCNFKQNSLAPDNPAFLLTDTKTLISSRFNTSEQLNSHHNLHNCFA